MKKKFTILVLLAVFGLSGFAQIIQENFNPSDDVWVEELSPTTNRNGQSLYIGRDPGGEGNHTLIRWDISSLPAGAVIDHAEIHIWEWSSTSGTIPCAYIKRITQSWSESTATWNNQPSTSSSYGTVCFSDLSSSDWFVMDYSAITDLVNDWLTYGNYGVMFQATPTATGYKTFNDAEDAHAPVLKIFYTITTVKEIQKTNIQIYPNPVSNELFVEFQYKQDVIINIFNSLGQQVYTEKIETDNETINISGLQKGLYFVEIKDLKGNILLSEKIIKE